jgi:TatD-related deoxyribonuclease
MTGFEPILDNHLHLDPVNGRGVDAAAEFANRGGTHLLVLNKPSGTWSATSTARTASVRRSS